uniref:Uncharacterized protein n=1 Tax=Physcomitrium patens TaxID=3218 RepID=A0A7I3Z948_PHYPA
MVCVSVSVLADVCKLKFKLMHFLSLSGAAWFNFLSLNWEPYLFALRFSMVRILDRNDFILVYESLPLLEQVKVHPL